MKYVIKYKLPIKIILYKQLFYKEFDENQESFLRLLDN